MWSISGKEKRSLTYDYKNRLRRQEINNLVLENGSFYIFCRDKFLKSKNRLFGKIGHFLMDRWKMYEIDSQEDLELCKFLYERKINVKQ